MEVRPGGEWLFVMHGPDGTDYDNHVVYSEVIAPRRLVYQHGEKGRPDNFLVTATFTTQGKQTRLDMQMLFDTQADRDRAIEKYGAIEGQQQTLNRLENYLASLSMHTRFIAPPGKPEIVVTHIFDAPADLVFKTWTIRN